MLHAGTFSTAFDIAPSAVPFDVAAVGEAGSVVISINPAAKTYTASITTLTDAEKAGDFSGSVVPLFDYTSCGPTIAVCSPFPASIIPVSRFSPFWARAMQALPEPNATGTVPNALMQTSGSFSGSHFAIDVQNNTALSKFGGIVQVPLGPFNLLGSTFTLYVDGVAVAAKEHPLRSSRPVRSHGSFLLEHSRPHGLSAAARRRLLDIGFLCL
jgi:hypothetical protein